jgi:hypothetical protein
MSGPGKTAPMVCAECSEPLNEVRTVTALGNYTGEIAYVHVLKVAHDHDPVPQPMAEHFEEDLTMFCDFCTSTEVKWSYRAEAIQLVALDDEDRALPYGGISANWAACEFCAKLIERKSLRALVNRAIAGGVPETARTGITELYRVLFPTFKSGRRRITRKLTLLRRWPGCLCGGAFSPCLANTRNDRRSDLNGASRPRHHYSTPDP